MRLSPKTLTLSAAAVLLTVVALCLAMAWESFGGGEAPPAFGESAGGDHAASGDSGLAADPESISAALGLGRGRGDAVADSDGDGVERDIVPSAADSGLLGVSVMVRDARGELPLPVLSGVEISYCEPILRDGQDRYDNVLAAVASPVRGVTNDLGLFVLPRLDRPVWVVARVPGEPAPGESLFGYARVRPPPSGEDGGTINLKVYPDFLLRARVVDESGQAVPSVPVLLSEYRGKRRYTRRQLRTDAQGRVELPHLQCLRRQVHVTKHDMEFALDVLLAERVAVRFPTTEPPEDELVLVIPETRPVVVRVQGPEGQPLGSHGKVELRRAKWWSLARDVRREVPVVDEEKGWWKPSVTFTHVGVGLTLEAHVVLDDDDFDWLGNPFQVDAVPEGSTDSVEPLIFEVPMPDRMGILEGRVTEARDGAPPEPVASASMSMLLTIDGVRIEGEDVLTDPSGKFELPFALQAEPVGPIRLQGRREAETRSDALASEDPIDGAVDVYGAFAAVERVANGRRLQSPDLVLDRADVLVAGAIVDDVGEPVTTARILLQRFRANGTAERGGPREWVTEAQTSTRVDEQGRFELRGRGTAGLSQRVRVTSPDHLDMSSRAFSPGESLDLSLMRFGSLSGVIQVPEWMRRDELRVTLRADAKGSRSRRLGVRIRNGQGTWSARRLPPGSYRFTLRTDDRADAFLTEEGVVVLPGTGHSVDARVADIDLTTVLRRYRIQARNSSGAAIKPVDGAMRILRPSPAGAKGGGTKRYDSVRFRSGVAEVIASDASLEILGYGRGLLPASATVSPGESSLVFETSAPAEVELVGLESLTSNVDVRLELALVGKFNRNSPEPRSTRVMRRKVASPQTGSVTRFPWSIPGRYRLRARLRQKNGPTAWVPLDSIENVGGGVPTVGPQRFRVVVAPAALQKALEVLEQRAQEAGNGPRGPRTR